MNFECREIVYTVLKFTKEEFDKIDKESEVNNWLETLEAESEAYPILMGSPFDDEDENMDLDIEESESLDDNTVYVIIYYTYEESSYMVSDDVSDNWTIRCDPVLAELDIACAMQEVYLDEQSEFFECESSNEKSETRIEAYLAGELIFEKTID